MERNYVTVTLCTDAGAETSASEVHVDKNVVVC